MTTRLKFSATRFVHSHPVTVQLRPRTRQIVVRGEEPEVTREYREDEDKLVSPSSSEAEKTKTPQTAYIDELPEVPRSELSPEMKERLKKEYYGLGGSPNKAMGANYFLYIILLVAGLAILSAALGYI